MNSERFTDQKPRVATIKDVRAKWGGAKAGRLFYCYLCGYQFYVGDVWRWVHGAQQGYGMFNFLVCQECDGDDVLERRKEWWEEWERLAKGRWRYIAEMLMDAETERR